MSVNHEGRGRSSEPSERGLVAGRRALGWTLNRTAAESGPLPSRI